MRALRAAAFFSCLRALASAFLAFLPEAGFFSFASDVFCGAAGRGAAGEQRVLLSLLGREPQRQRGGAAPLCCHYRGTRRELTLS